MFDLLAFVVVVALVIYAVMWFQRKSNAAFSQPGNSKVVVTDAARHKLEDEMKRKAESMDHEMVILYATQTGTAQTFCKTLYKEAERYGVKAALFDVENFPQEQLEKEKIVCFVVATYGEGEPPDSAKPFHDWFTDEYSAPQLTSTKFAVFGLGDKQYTHFCEMGIQYDKRMEALGATRICPTGLGDASTDIEVEFDMWRANLWPGIGQALNRQLKCDSDEPQLPETTLRFIDGEQPAAFPFPKAAASIAPNLRQPAWVPICGHQSLLKKKFPDRETMLIKFDISGTALTYQAGDHLAILPHNSDETIDRYLKLLKISDDDAKRVIALADNKTKRNQLPAWVTVRDALKWYVDLCGKPKRSVLRILAHYSTSTAKRDQLLGLLRMSDEAQQSFHDQEHALRDVGGFLKQYDCDVPLGHFLEVMPRMQPRWFSIASDQLHTKTEIHVVVAVVDQGVCTGMLQRMTVGDQVCVFVRKSTFHLNRQYKTRPIICVGPGTGIAPLVGFMARREAWASKNNDIGRCLFYFGCRRRDEDFMFEQELDDWKNRKIITDLFVAFSREQEQKVYVQSLIAENAKDIWELIAKESAMFYICGDAKKMAKDVMSELTRIAMQQGSMNEDAAVAYWNKMEKDGRLLKDVWSG